MIDKIKGLFKYSFFYGIGNLIIKASGLILMPLYALYITKAELGLLAMYETVYMFILVVTGWGVKGGFSRWFNDMKSVSDKKSLFFTTYIFNLFTSFFGVLLTVFILFYIDIFKTSSGYSILIIFALSSLFKLLYDVPFILLRLEQKAFKQTSYLIFNVLLTVVFTVYQLKFRHSGFEGIFKAQLLANCLTFVVILPLIIKSCAVKWHGKLLKEMIHYGFPLAISNILTLILTISDRYILEAYYSLEAVGSFSVAIRVANLLQVLIMASFLTSYTYQYYKSMNEDDGSRYHLKIFTYFVFFMVVCGLGIVYFGKEIIYVLMAGRTEYFDAIPVIPLLIIGLIFSGVRQIFVLPLSKLKQARLISMVMIVAGIVNVGLNLLIIPVFGKEGAAFTTAISQLIAAIWLWFKLRQFETIHYEWKKIIIIFSTGCVYSVVLFLLPSLSWVLDILIKSILLISYFVLLYFLNVFEEVEIQRVKQFLDKFRKSVNITSGK